MKSPEMYGYGCMFEMKKVLIGFSRYIGIVEISCWNSMLGIFDIGSF